MGERYETTVHDKDGNPVAGCDGDALTRIRAQANLIRSAEARIRELEAERNYVRSALDESERRRADEDRTARTYREALERIAATHDQSCECNWDGVNEHGAHEDDVCDCARLPARQALLRR